MRKHPFDLTSLLAGLVFVAFAAVYLGAAAADERVDASWVLPITLVALGLAGLAGGLTRAVNGAGRAETGEPTEETGTGDVA